MFDQDRNLKKFVQVTDIILKHKPELKVLLSKIKLKSNININDKEITVIAHNFKPLSEYMRIKCNDFKLPQLAKGANAYKLPESDKMLQLRKREDVNQGVFKDLIITLNDVYFIEYKEQTPNTYISNVEKFIESNQCYSKELLTIRHNINNINN
jgi:hypothetical protein